jgi:hypothetical protein
MHADWTLLPRGYFPERPDIQLRTAVELASTFVKLLLDALALFLMFLPVFILAILVAIPNALAIPTFLEGITLLSARRTHLGRSLTLLGILVIFILSFCRFVERHGTEQLGSCRRCTILFR